MTWKRLIIFLDHQHFRFLLNLRRDVDGCRCMCLLASLVSGHWLESFIQPLLVQIPVGFALAISITCCTRLLLNIRDAYYAQTQSSPYLSSRHALNTPSIGTASDFWEDDDRPTSDRAPSIYADYASRDQWAFELRAMKWSGGMRS